MQNLLLHAHPINTPTGTGPGVTGTLFTLPPVCVFRVLHFLITVRSQPLSLLAAGLSLAYSPYLKD